MDVRQAQDDHATSATAPQKRVTGIGGIFFKSEHAEDLAAWYQRHLGLPVAESGVTTFRWREDDAPEKVGMTVWSTFPADTEYFNPSKAPFMINYRVEDLAGLLRTLREEGLDVDERTEDSEYGRFAWISDPEGNRIELWQPPDEPPKG